MALSPDQVKSTGSFLRLICYFLHVELEVERRRQENDRRKMFAMLKQIGASAEKFFDENPKELFDNTSSRVGQLMRVAKQWHYHTDRHLREHAPGALEQRTADQADLGRNIEAFFKQFPEQRPEHSSNSLFSKEEQNLLR